MVSSLVFPIVSVSFSFLNHCDTLSCHSCQDLFIYKLINNFVIMMSLITLFFH